MSRDNDELDKVLKFNIARKVIGALVVLIVIGVIVALR